MRTILGMLALLMSTGCNNTPKPYKNSLISKPIQKKIAPADTTTKPEIKYSAQQLEAFMDSVALLPEQTLADKVAFGADSIFKNFTKPMNRQVSPGDLSLLKKAIPSGMINHQIVKKIFGELLADTLNKENLHASIKNGKIELEYFPFDPDRNKFDEFAVRVGGHYESSILYFFKGSKIIAKQSGYSRYDDIEYYREADGHAVVYRTSEFDHGSGIWWLNYFFYKYKGNKLIPVLNILQNGNMQAFWGLRILWLEATVVKTPPLTLKMVYNQQFFTKKDEGGFNYGPKLINDSTMVTYSWNKDSTRLEGQYANSKTTEHQILTYYLNNNEMLFIKLYHAKLKQLLHYKKSRKWVLNYLNQVKNYALK